MTLVQVGGDLAADLHLIGLCLRPTAGCFKPIEFDIAIVAGHSNCRKCRLLLEHDALERMRDAPVKKRNHRAANKTLQAVRRVSVTAFLVPIFVLAFAFACLAGGLMVWVSLF